MTVLLSNAAAICVCSVLVLAAAAHVLRPQALFHALLEQQVFPRFLATLVAVLVPLIEATAAGLVVTMLAGGSPKYAAPATALFVAFFVYLALVRVRTGGDVSCGCGIGEERLSWYVVARPLLLAGVTGFCFLRSGSQNFAALPSAEAAIAVSLGVSIAALITYSPQLATLRQLEAVEKVLVA